VLGGESSFGVSFRDLGMFYHRGHRGAVHYNEEGFFCKGFRHLLFAFVLLGALGVLGGESSFGVFGLVI